jgi:hypothetical protein
MKAPALIAWLTGGYNPAVSRIVTGDIVAVVALGFGIAVFAYRHSGGKSA